MTHQPEKIKSLFGEFSVPSGFEPLKPLEECDEEVLLPIIDGLLFENKYSIISGDKNTYKSWLASYMAVCIALGKPCFGRPVYQGKVVYIYGEGNITSRLKKICESFGCKGSRHLYPYQLRADLTVQDMIDDLKRHIPPNTKVIFIDNFEKFWASDMDPTIVNEAMKFIRQIREYTAVSLIHHTVKGAPQSGEPLRKSKGLSQIMNNADSAMCLTRRGAVVTCELYTRDMEEQLPFNFRLVNEENGVITLEEIEGSEYPPQIDKKVNQQECFKMVRDILAQELIEPMNKTRIYNEVLKGKKIRGLSGSSFYGIIFPKLVEEGVLVSEGGKGYLFKKTN